ncbi:hypothetical protein [Altererythrobacter lauratis]|uniref:Lipoprotein n=1 Tax=Alteraurantiacibacter lauratis TaxID=2054627 RepID=A0ABV7ED03_9SPHN
MRSAKALLAAVILPLAACKPPDGAAPRLRQIANPLAENLYRVDRNEDGTALLGLHVGQVRLQGRCLLLDYDGSQYTPVFVYDRDNVTVSANSITIGRFTAEYGQPYYFPGLIVRSFDMPRRDNCAAKTAFITEIADIADF